MLFIMWILQWIMCHNCFHSVRPKCFDFFFFPFGPRYVRTSDSFLSLLKESDIIFSQHMSETRWMSAIWSSLLGLSVFRLNPEEWQEDRVSLAEQIDSAGLDLKVDLSCQYPMWHVLKTAWGGVRCSWGILVQILFLAYFDSTGSDVWIFMYHHGWSSNIQDVSFLS